MTSTAPARGSEEQLAMRSDRTMRASDAERERVVDALAEHSAAGRLTLAELDQRSEAAFAAVTLAELDRVLIDLPALRPRGPAATRPARAARRERVARLSAVRAAPVTNWALTAVICLAVWVVTSLANREALYFWPMWVIGPWGLVLLHSTFAGRPSLCGAAPGRHDATP